MDKEFFSGVTPDGSYPPSSSVIRQTRFGKRCFNWKEKREIWRNHSFLFCVCCFFSKWCLLFLILFFFFLLKIKVKIIVFVDKYYVRLIWITYHHANRFFFFFFTHIRLFSKFLRFLTLWISNYWFIKLKTFLTFDGPRAEWIASLIKENWGINLVCAAEMMYLNSCVCRPLRV